MVTAIKPLIELSPVPRESKAIAALGYDAATQTLAVKFAASNTIHHYGEFSQKKYDEMMAAESIGVFHAKHIRNQHPHSIPSEETLD